MKPKTLFLAGLVATTVASSMLLVPAASAVLSADLVVSQVASPRPNGVVVMAVSVTNNGPAAAGATTLTELIGGTGITATSFTSNNTGTTCTPITAPPGFNKASSCTIPQLRPSRTWKLRFTINAKTGTAIKSQATAKGTTADPNTANNVSTATSWTGPVADVGIAFGSNTGTGPVTASILVTNSGPNKSGEVDLKTSSGQFVASTPNPLCPVSTDATQCTLPAVPAGSSITVMVQFTPPRIGGTGPTVKILKEFGSFDPNAVNNKVVVPRS
jgi:hypothetical protein